MYDRVVVYLPEVFVASIDLNSRQLHITYLCRQKIKLNRKRS